MKKTLSTFVLSAVLMTPVVVRAMDDHDQDHRDRDAQGRYYDPAYRDYHEWNEHEERAYREYLRERHLENREWGDPGRPNARLFGLEVEHLPHHARLPEQVPVEPCAVRRQAVHVIGDHAKAERSIAGDVLAAGDPGRQRLTVPFLKKVQRESKWTGGHALPTKLPTHHLLEGRQLVGISR